MGRPAGANRARKAPVYSADAMAIRYLFGLLLIAAGIVVTLAAVVRLRGSMFDAVRTVCFGSLGVLAVVLPVLLIWAGVLAIYSAQRRAPVRPWLFALLGVFVVSAFLVLVTRYGDLPYLDYLKSKSTGQWGDIIRRSYIESAVKGAKGQLLPGGAAGCALAWPLHVYCGDFLGCLILGVLLILCVLAAFRLSPAGFIRLIRGRHGQASPGSAQKKQPAERREQKTRAEDMRSEEQWQTDAQADPRYYDRPGAGDMTPPAGPGAMSGAAEQLRFAVPDGRVQPGGGQYGGKQYGNRQPGGEQYGNGQYGGGQPGNGQYSGVQPGGGQYGGGTYTDQRLSRTGKSRAFGKPGTNGGSGKAGPAAGETRPASKRRVKPKTPEIYETPETPEARPKQLYQTQPEPGYQTRSEPEYQARPTPEYQARPTPEYQTQPEPEYRTPAERQPVQESTKRRTARSDDTSARRASVTDEAQAQSKGGGGAQRTTAVSAEERNIDEKSLSIYTPPPMEALSYPKHGDEDTSAEDEMRSRRLEETLASFRVQAHVAHVTHGPAISRFELELATGIKVGKVAELEKDIAYGMEAASVRIEAPIPGKSLVGVEVPNRKVEVVTLREVLDSPPMRKSKSILTVALGKDIAGAPVVCDLARMPHMLIAGATGSGKSVCINVIINSLLYRAGPEDVRLILVDPKVVELQCYQDIPHLLIPVVNDPRKAASALAWAVAEMMERYDRFAERKVRNLEGYNSVLAPGEKPMYRIVIIIDELSDLMMACKKDVESYIVRLTQLARAAGIHLIVATQRPSVDVITGLIKANIPSRIAFKTASSVDSRTIIDRNGAEQLLGWGDMLYAPTGSFSPVRVQGCYLSDDEVNTIVANVRENNPNEYDPNILEKLEELGRDQDKKDMSVIGGAPENDDSDRALLEQCVEYALADGQISTSTLQRRMKIGYARAGRLTDMMEERGFISAKDGSKPRKCLITREEWEKIKCDTEDAAPV